MGIQAINSVVIAGAGPAGTSLAIRLARSGFDVTLVERESFPRHKLCGEFISPECLAHFAHLDVENEMLEAGACQIDETRFYSRSGRNISIASSVLGGRALGLSRAKMDHILLEKARSVGVEINTGTMVTGLKADQQRCVSLSTRNGTNSLKSISGDLFVDATGRAAALSKLFARSIGRKDPISRPPAHIAFKAHFRNADIDPAVCEMYAFAAGYGGINTVEDGLANFCYILKTKAARDLGGAAEAVAEAVIRQNPRTCDALKNADIVGDWLAVSIHGFGSRPTEKIPNLVSVGDSAAFIDPFTGSGMLLAMESSALLAACIDENRSDLTSLLPHYRHRHHRSFSRRFRMASLLRYAADRSAAASALIATLSIAPGVDRVLARATRA